MTAPRNDGEESVDKESVSGGRDRDIWERTDWT